MKVIAGDAEQLAWAAWKCQMPRYAPKSAYESLNSTLHLASASSAARFGFGGNIASISSFHWTACAKVMRTSCEAMPLQSGNSNPGASCNCPSLGGTSMLEFFTEFLVALLQNSRLMFRFVQVQEHAHNLGSTGFWRV